MESRVLNFVDAMQMAKILCLHLDSPTGELTEDTASLINKMSGEDLGNLLTLLTGERENLPLLAERQTLLILLSGLSINKYQALMGFYSREITHG